MGASWEKNQLFLWEGGGGWRGLVQLSHLLGSKSQMIIGQKTGESAQYYGRVFRKEPTFGGGGS